MSSSSSFSSSSLVFVSSSSPPPRSPHDPTQFPAADALRLIGEYCLTASKLHHLSLASKHYYHSLSHPLCWQCWKLSFNVSDCRLTLFPLLSPFKQHHFPHSSLENISSRYTLLKNITHLDVNSFSNGAVLLSLLHLFPSFSSMTISMNIANNERNRSWTTKWFDTLPVSFFSTARDVSIASFPISLLQRILPSYFSSLIHFHLSIDGTVSPSSTPIQLPSSLKHLQIDCRCGLQLFVLPSTLETLYCTSLSSLSHCFFAPQQDFLPELKYLHWFMEEVEESSTTIAPTVSAPQLETIEVGVSDSIDRSAPMTVPFLCSSLHHITLHLFHNTVLGAFQVIPHHSIASLKSLRFDSYAPFGDVVTHSTLPPLYPLLLQLITTLPVFPSLRIISFDAALLSDPSADRNDPSLIDENDRAMKAFATFCMAEKNKFPVLEYVGEKRFSIHQTHYTSQPPADLERVMDEFLEEREKESKDTNNELKPEKELEYSTTSSNNSSNDSSESDLDEEKNSEQTATPVTASNTKKRSNSPSSSSDLTSLSSAKRSHHS